MPFDAAGHAVEDRSKAKVFISYSRKDMAFADRLDAALNARGFEPLIDRTDIFAFEEWWKRVEALIARADTVVFVLSPDAVRPGTIALKEVDFAASLNKRFAPIVFRPVDDKSVPEALAKLNFIFFDNEAQFDTSADRLAEALNTDISWIRQHTEFGEMARRWLSADKPNGLLLRSPVLEQAERWVAGRPGGAPASTALQRAYISESRRRATRTMRAVAIGSLAVGVISIGLALFAFFQQRRAETSETKTLQTAATSDFQRGSTLLLQPETTPEGVALLARAIRLNKDKRAITRLWSMLQQRQFWVRSAQRPGSVPDPRQVDKSIINAVTDKISKLAFGELRDGDNESVSVSGDGRLVFTGLARGAGLDARYRIWNANGTPVTDWIEPNNTGDNWIFKLNGYLSQAGDVLALVIECWRSNAYLQIIDMKTKEQIGSNIPVEGLWPPFEGARFSTVEFVGGTRDSKDGLLLVTGSDKGDAAVHLIRDESFRNYARLTTLARNRHPQPIVFAALDEKREWLMSAAADGSVLVTRVEDDNLRAVDEARPRGTPVGNFVRVQQPVSSIRRISSDEITVSFEDGQQQSFVLTGPWKFDLNDGASPKQTGRICKMWNPKGLDLGAEEQDRQIAKAWEITGGREYTLNHRQLEYRLNGVVMARSPIFQSDLALACLSERRYLSITTKSFVSEIWAEDFSRRFGVAISEQLAFTAVSGPETTNLTVVSDGADIILIRSHTPSSPDYGTLWYSAWDTATALPLIDRVGTRELEYVALSLRFSENEKYIIFTMGLHNVDGDTFSWIQLKPPAEALTWLPDFAEALVDTRLSADGNAEPVKDTDQRLSHGFIRLGELAIK